MDKQPMSPFSYVPCAVHIRITGQMEENSHKIFPMGVGQHHEYENRDATA